MITLTEAEMKTVFGTICENVDTIDLASYQQAIRDDTPQDITEQIERIAGEDRDILLALVGVYTFLAISITNNAVSEDLLKNVFDTANILNGISPSALRLWWHECDGRVANLIDRLVALRDVVDRVLSDMVIVRNY